MSFSPRSPRRGPMDVRRPGRLAAAGVVAAACLGLAACAGGAGGATPASGQNFVSGTPGTTLFSAESGPTAPKVSGQTLTGSRISLSELRGHVVVINFWGSWCTPCRAEAPTLAALDYQLRPSGVRFLGVDIRDSVTSAQAFEGDFGITYPSLNDPADEIALDFRATVPPEGIPTTLVVAADGRITARVIGEVSYRGLRGLISAAVARPS